MKSKATETEPLSGDILGLLWTHVINPDPGGAWLDTALKNSTSAPEPLKTALPAIKRLLALKNSREDLGRVARLERYERCFGLLYELDDPGLESGKLTGLRAQLLKPSARSGKEAAFIDVLWEGIGDAADEGERWADVSPKAKADNEPFGDVDAAVARLRKAGAQPCDLEVFARWQRFDATVGALHVFERAGIKDAEELIGLHESILGAEPSGKEARPNSWPGSADVPAAQAASDPTKPFLELKGIEGFCYTPDGKGLILGWRQVIDAETGTNRFAYEVKGWPSSGAFSSDHTRLILTAEPNKIMICDAKTGKLLSSMKWPGNIRNLRVMAVPNSEGFLVETVIHNPNGKTDQRYFALEADTLKIGKEFRFLPDNTTTREFEWTPDGNRLLATFCTLGAGGVAYHLQAWNWPELQPLWTNPALNDSATIAISADGKHAAVASNGEVRLLDPQNGKDIAQLTVKDTLLNLAFAPGGQYLAIGEHDTGAIHVWDFTTRKVVRELNIGTKWCFGVCFSPDGKILGAAGHRKSMFWRFEPLIASR